MDIADDLPALFAGVARAISCSFSWSRPGRLLSLPYIPTEFPHILRPHHSIAYCRLDGRLTSLLHHARPGNVKTHLCVLTVLVRAIALSMAFAIASSCLPQAYFLLIYLSCTTFSVRRRRLMTHQRARAPPGPFSCVLPCIASHVRTRVSPCPSHDNVFRARVELHDSSRLLLPLLR